MDALLGAVASDEAFSGLDRRDSSLAVPDPARSAVIAAIAARRRNEGRGPLVAVVPSGGAAERLESELQALLSPSVVAMFPAWETLPFEHVSPSTETVGLRARALWQLQSALPPTVVVTPVRAVMQRVGPGVTRQKPLVFKPGNEIDLGGTLERLGSWGYERAYQVEAHGEFAVRGGILDIWPAGEADPIRVELWGDEIEEVRRFSVADQRTVGKITTKLNVFPCRELPPGREVADAAEHIEAPAQVREHFAEEIFFAGMESWLPWVHPDAPTLPELLPDDSLVVLCDPRSCIDRCAMLRDEEVALAESLLETWDFAKERADELPRLYGDPDRLLADSRLDVLRLVPAPEDPATAIPAISPLPSAGAALAAEAAKLAAGGWCVLVATPDPDASSRIAGVLTDEGTDATRIGPLNALKELPSPGIWVGELTLESGFLLQDAKIALITLSDLRGRVSRAGRRPMQSRRAASADFFADIGPGDYVVHYQHGIGRFAGMVTRAMAGVERDYLLIEYAGDDKLYVPSDQLDAVRKYSGGETPRLSRLGGSEWARATGKARAEAARIAERFVQLYRDRITIEGHAFTQDTPWQRDLEASFPHALTADQARTLVEIKSDMESPQPMERLVCGDVGYGKTELAVRAAFKAVQDGKQVALLAPTTLLAQQHYQTFGERFEDFPTRVEMLSRFVPKRDEKRILADLSSGGVDVVIGTHRILQSDVMIPRLGLLIIDEEQRFGVAHKEALKEIRREIDVLTLTATPIPRTLEMSLAGIRDMSTIATPPEERRPVITYVGEYDEGAVSAAIRREMLRDGQVFYVHNRVRSIDRALSNVQSLVPAARVASAHGQMPESQLEKTMLSFYSGEIDVLVTTTIVESGLDIHSVNTLIVERADMLGLAQLYQLRGRVGRGRERAYSYFFYPERRQLTEEAYERLKTIGEHTELGSGFAIARRDLEIRGAGNILGEAQSGHIAAVGFDLYCQLVSDAVSEMRGAPVEKISPVRIELPVNAHIPESYIGQETLRLEAYRKLAAASSPEAVADVRAEWSDRFGPLPAEAESLFDVAEIRAECTSLGIEEVVYTRNKVRLAPVELKASQRVRAERIAKGAVYKADTAQLTMPLRSGSGMVDELLSLLRRILKRPEKNTRSPRVENTP